jgi:hypothetical protein
MMQLRMFDRQRSQSNDEVAWFVRPCGERVPTRFRRSHVESALVVLEPMEKGPVQAVCVRGRGGTIFKQEYGQSFWLGDREPVAVRVPLAYLPG